MKRKIKCKKTVTMPISGEAFTEGCVYEANFTFSYGIAKNNYGHSSHGLGAVYLFGFIKSKWFKEHFILIK